MTRKNNRSKTRKYKGFDFDQDGDGAITDILKLLGPELIKLAPDLLRLPVQEASKFLKEKVADALGTRGKGIDLPGTSGSGLNLPGKSETVRRQRPRGNNMNISSCHNPGFTITDGSKKGAGAVLFKVPYTGNLIPQYSPHVGAGKKQPVKYLPRNLS